MTKRRFEAIFATILAQACAEPHAAIETAKPPPPAPVLASEAPPAAVAAPTDAGVAALASVEDPNLDRAPNREYLDDAPPFEWVANEWPKLARDALPANVTFVAFVWNGTVTDAIGKGPPAATLVEKQKGAMGDAGASGAFEKPIAWVADGVLTFGGRRDLRKALTPIDSREKAAMLLHYGYGVTLRDDAAQSGKPCALCNGPLVRPANGGFEVFGLATTEKNIGPCPHSNPSTLFFLVAYAVDSAGQVTAKGAAHPFPNPPIASAHCVGRDTHGSGRLHRTPVSLGDYFAQLAHDEAISVRSFERLARELAEAGNHALSTRARLAAGQERGHVRRMVALRRKHGGAPRRLPRTGKLPTRPLVDWLVENVREGCVNETFAALVASHQAEHAPDADQRAAFLVIAEEEREHARLAADIHAWAVRRHPQLALVLLAARAEAIERLRASIRPGRADVGEPPREVARRFVSGLDQLSSA